MPLSTSATRAGSRFMSRSASSSQVSSCATAAISYRTCRVPDGRSDGKKACPGLPDTPLKGLSSVGSRRLLGGFLRPAATALARHLRRWPGQRPLGVGPGLLLGNQLVALRRNLAQTPEHAAGPGRDQAADDYVLLQALEEVDLAVDGGVGQHARGLLEGRGRDKRARLQRGFRDAEQDRLGGCWPLALLLEHRVHLVELDPIELLALDEVGVTDVGDLDLLQHLTDDHLDVLVVDRHALQPVDVLDLVDQVVGELLDALDGEDVVRGRMAVIHEVSPLDAVAVLHGKALAARDQVLDRLLLLVIRLDGDPLLVLVVLAELDGA